MSDSCDPMNCSTPGFPVCHQLPDLAQTHVHWVGWCYLTISSSTTPFSLCLQSFPASKSFPVSQFFTSGSQSIGASASANPSNEYSGFISFRLNLLDLAVQGTLKSLLQHHSSKASILQCSTFFIVQLSHPYMTTGKTIALTRWTCVDKVMSLLFNIAV